jgi:hypothetical protein
MQVQVNELGCGAQSHFRWRHSNGKCAGRGGALSTERSSEVENRRDAIDLHSRRARGNPRRGRHSPWLLPEDQVQ